jgi:diguanylate cyclase
LQRLFGHRDSEEAPTLEAAPAPASAATPTPAAAAPEPEPSPQPGFAAVEPVVAAPVIKEATLVETPKPVAKLQPEPEPEPEVVAFEPPKVAAETVSAPAQAEPTETEPAFEPELEVVAPSAPIPTAPIAINPDELTHPGDSPSALILDSLPLPEPMAQALAAIDPEQPEHDILFALPDSPEPSYSSVARHIEETLLGPARRPDAARAPSPASRIHARPPEKRFELV